MKKSQSIENSLFRQPDDEQEFIEMAQAEFEKIAEAYAWLCEISRPLARLWLRLSHYELQRTLKPIEPDDPVIEDIQTLHLLKNITLGLAAALSKPHQLRRLYGITKKPS